MALAGFVGAGQWSPVYMRQLIFGVPKSGKSTYCGTWPAPLMLHPVVESGYDTFRRPDGTNLFPHVKLGSEQHLWLAEPAGKEKHTRVSDELRQWIRQLSIDLDKGTCPFQTIVLGGFTMLQSLVIAEGEKLKSGGNKYATWDYVLKWSTELLQTLCTLPIHVIFECGADNVTKDVNAITAARPALSGKAYQNLLADVNVILWQECIGGRYFTAVSTGKSQVNGVRFSFLNTPQPVENCCYDWFAQRLGLPPIYVVDPNHPRVLYNGTPGWPWTHATF